MIQNKTNLMVNCLAKGTKSPRAWSIWLQGFGDLVGSGRPSVRVGGMFFVSYGTGESNLPHLLGKAGTCDTYQTITLTG